VRQVRYSLRNENAIDLVLFLNGIPVATVELKSDFTQSVDDAVDQYRYDRNPRPKGQGDAEPLLAFPRGALVHFAVSQSEVRMTTRLEGTKTNFLPFNQGDHGGAGNPVREGFRTSYLWEQVWECDSWLEILGRYLVTPRDSKKQIKALNDQVLQKLNMVRGVNHVEFIKRSSDGKFFMLESAARVGGAHIAETIEGATGVNLWEEWANVEVDYALGKPYQPKPTRQEYGGLAITLAKQEQPDLSSYDDPEIFYRAPEKQHVGLVLRSKDHARIQQLLDSYQERFVRDFTAVMPAKKSPQARAG